MENRLAEVARQIYGELPAPMDSPDVMHYTEETMNIPEAAHQLDIAGKALQAAAAALVENTPPVVVHPLTDRRVRLKPAPQVLGPAGSSWLDPVFGSRMWRVTDLLSNGGAACHAPSSIGGAWNSDGTKFAGVGAGGNALFFGFDGVTISPLPARINAQNEPWFSYVDPNVVYGCAYNHNTGSYRLVRTWDIATKAVTDVLDLDATYGALSLAPGGYCGPLTVVDHDVWAVLFGGTSQDQHQYIHHSVLGLFDSSIAVVQTNAGPVTGFKMHGFALDRLGRLLVMPSGADLTAHPGMQQIQVVDPITKTLTPISKVGGGHLSLGYGTMVNQDCCSASSWDSAQWQFRRLDNLDTTKDLIVPVLTPKLTTLSDHSSWRHARADKPLPFLSSTFRTDSPLSTPWRAWDDEIISIATDGSGQVARHCHHRAKQTGDYWNQPLAHIDPTGRYAIFTSNWEEGVGVGRQDIFLVELA